MLGRTAAENVKNPSTGKVIVKAGELMEEEQVEAIEEARVQEIRIRSALTCETRNGICAKCYGRDLARGTPVNLGEAVGVIAAQSIGEPGTQLTMRTFHLGGVAIAKVVDQSSLESNFDGTVKIKQRNVVKDSQGRLMVMGRNTILVVPIRTAPSVPCTGCLTARICAWTTAPRSSAAIVSPSGTPIPGRCSPRSKALSTSRIWSKACRSASGKDELTGITNIVIIDWRASPRGADLRPAGRHQGQEGQDRQAVARRRGALPPAGGRDHVGRVRAIR